jgi:hypothetical protein
LGQLIYIRTKNRINHLTENSFGIFLHLVKPSDKFFSLGRLNSAVGAQNADQNIFFLFCTCMKLKYGFEFTNCRSRTIRQKTTLFLAALGKKSDPFWQSGNNSL